LDIKILIDALQTGESTPANELTNSSLASKVILSLWF